MTVATAALADMPPVWAVTNGVFPSNCYVCETGASGACFIVDPGLDPAPIEALLAQRGLEPVAVVCTHGHFDHAGSAAHFQQRHACPVYLSGAELKTLRSSNFLLMAFKIPVRMQMPDVTSIGAEEPFVAIGECRIRFHPAPGHTPGSCLVEHGNTLFTGDTIYSRGVGLSRLPGEDSEQLRRSILDAWNRFPDRMLVRPGHGESCTLGEIKRENQALLRFLDAPCSPLSAS
jgi:hydroxyacylglutathione hydrolase